MTRAAVKETDKTNDTETFNVSRARLVRRGPRRPRPSRLSLRALRTAADRTQVNVSEATGISQGDISKLENRTNLDEFNVSTLRRYVEALGAELEIVAVFPTGHRIAVAPATED